MATKFLATLVAAMFLFGCASNAGESGNVAPDNNGNKQVQADAGSQAQGDASSSPETTKTEVDPCPAEYTARIDGKKLWYCDIEVNCPLELVRFNGKICAISCPGAFTAKLPDQAKFISETELFYQVTKNQHTCTLVAN